LFSGGIAIIPYERIKIRQGGMCFEGFFVKFRLTFEANYNIIMRETEHLFAWRIR